MSDGVTWAELRAMLSYREGEMVRVSDLPSGPQMHRLLRAHLALARAAAALLHEECGTTFCSVCNGEDENHADSCPWARLRAALPEGMLEPEGEETKP